MTAKVKPHVHDSMVLSVLAAENGLEEWKDVPGYEGLYLISNKGKLYCYPRYVRGRSGVKIYRQCRVTRGSNRNGYRIVTLTKDGQKVNTSLHALVMRAFVGEYPEGKQVAHWDGKRDNNRLINLRYATPKENAADKKRHGTQTCGAKHPGVKVTKRQLKIINDLLTRATGYANSNNSIAIVAGVSSAIVNSIRKGIHWSCK